MLSDKTNGAAEEAKGEELKSEAEKGTDQSATGAATEGKSESGQSDKTFTQDDVNRMMAREKQQGRAAALKELGLDPQNEKALRKLKAFLVQDEEESEEGDGTNESAKELQAIKLQLQVAEATADAMKVGVQPQYVDDVVTLAMSKLTDETDLKSVIGEFKSKYPTWFGESESEDGKKTLPDGTGTSVKTTKKDKGGEMSLGERLAATRKSQQKKSNYWKND